MIYVHTSASAFSKGGLRLIHKAISKVPKQIQADIVDAVYIINSKTRLNFRLTKAKVLCKIAETGLFGKDDLNFHIFRLMQKFDNIYEFVQFLIYRALKVEIFENDGEKTYVDV